MIMDIIALINLLMRNSVTDILEHKNHVDGKNNYGEDTDNDLLDWSIPSISQGKKLKLIFFHTSIIKSCCENNISLIKIKYPPEKT